MTARLAALLLISLAVPLSTASAQQRTPTPSANELWKSYPLQTHPTPGSEAVDALPPIWPTGPTVHWPPPTPVDDLGDLHKVTRVLQIAPPLAPVSGP